ncbi:hypothetical protein [Ilumatobacter sp.]|uniref:hypothetical protein n=1 Tax=Ilumatobacter sp. TaxID=1967498 RepID=UPI003C51C9FB
MATSSSSTKKAARLAQKGKGQKVRFQGGALFPLIVALVVVLGFGLIIYARQSRPSADASAPTIEDHWHHAYGFLICDTWVQLDGDGEAQDANGQPTNVEYARTGIHSHDDGLIHWHPFSSASVGGRAKLGVFLDTYGVELSEDELQFPEDQRAQLPEEFQETGRFESGETECTIDGETSVGHLQVTRWNNLSDTDEGTTFIAGFDDVALNEDAMVVSIAFVPDGTTVGKPPSVEGFDENSLNDSGQQTSNELFPGVDVTPDGDVTVGTALLDPEDIGPAVESESNPTETETTEAAADEAES